MIKELYERELITPPKWLPDATCYETLMGSYAYGVSEDNSDTDVYGFCVPPVSIVFPHTAGYIHGFGTPPESFEQYQQHHVYDWSDRGQQYDLQIYSIVKYFHLCMGCNPNMIDSLFTPDSAILHKTKIAEMVRSNRKIFLSKLAWGTFRGYAYSQIKKLANKKPEGHRAVLVEKYGYDVKYAYHLVRLLDEAEQILKTGDIDITRDKERLREIRNGGWTENQVLEFFKSKSSELDRTYEESSVQEEPREAQIYNLLCECLEEAYGCLKKINLGSRFTKEPYGTKYLSL